MLYFFLSYARGDDDEYVKRFYSDLCREIRVRKGAHPNEEVGFLDVNSIGLGSSWPEKLVDALSTCRVFLSLYSPGYFLSETCGKEWAAFRRRLDRHQEAAGVAANSLIPIMWYTPTSLHPVTRAIQYRAESLGATYDELGLRQMIRLRRFRDEYEELVTALAAEIVEAAERHRLVPEPPGLSLASIESPFHRPRATEVAAVQQTHPEGGHNLASGPRSMTQPAAGETSMPPSPGEDVQAPAAVEDDRPGRIRSPGNRSADIAPTGAKGSRHVHFVIASGVREELAPIRRTLDYYGDIPQHWAPYRPQTSQPLGDLASVVAQRHRFGSELADLEGLPDRIERANSDNQIVVLLIDPWITRLDRQSEVLAHYDSRNEPTIPVLISFSDDDQETMRYIQTLHAGLAHVLQNNSLRVDPIFRPEVRNARQFEEDLQEVLQEAQNRVFQRGIVFRRPTAPQARRPVLEGP